MKRTIVLTLAFLVLLCSVSHAAVLAGKKNSIGLDSPFIGWLNPNWIDKDGNSKTISNLGVNLGLGVSYKRYFEMVKTNQFNTYWAAGTFFLIIPYLGIGGDYVWDNGFYLGAGLIWICPEIHGGFMF
jgi:hypothetical protein